MFLYASLSGAMDYAAIMVRPVIMILAVIQIKYAVNFVVLKMSNVQIIPVLSVSPVFAVAFVVMKVRSVLEVHVVRRVKDVGIHVVEMEKFVVMENV